MEKRIYRPLEAVSAEEVQRILAGGTRRRARAPIIAGGRTRQALGPVAGCVFKAHGR